MMALILSSCYSQQLQPGPVVGIKFCKPGVFEIHSDIIQWTMLQQGLWKGQFAQLKVSTTAKNLPATIPGFYYLKEVNGNIRLQAEICQKTNYPIDKLDIYLVSKVKPGKLSLIMRENTTQDDYFVSFKANHFQCANVHPRSISIGQQNQNIFLRLFFENLPQPLLKLQQTPSNNPFKRPIYDTIVSGLYFDNQGEFDIKATIANHEWSQVQPEQWMAKLQRLTVNVQNVTCYYSGFCFYTKDKVVDKHRYQMEIDAAKNGQIQGPPLEILIKSPQRPGKLSFSVKQRIPAHKTIFVPFAPEHFTINNTRASFLVHDFINDRPPSICLTFRNQSKPVKQKTSTARRIQIHPYGIFIPLAHSLSKGLYHDIGGTFLNNLGQKLIQFINKKKLDIRILTYPNNTDPFTAQILNSPVMTIEQNRKDRVITVIQENLQHFQYIAFAHLEEELLQKNLVFKLYVYSKANTTATIISESVDVTPNIQNNINMAMESTAKQLATLKIRQLTATTTKLVAQSYATYEDIYALILKNNWYCTPDVSNKEKQKAIQELANKQSLSEQEILNKMKTFKWASTFSIKTDTSSDIFVQIVRNVTTEHIHNFSKPIFSIFMHCWLPRKISTMYELRKFSQKIKTYAGIVNWRVPTIEELIRIFQVKDLFQAANPLKQNSKYYFWSSTPAKNKQSFWIVLVNRDNHNTLMLDIEKGTTSNATRMLIVSDNKL